MISLRTLILSSSRASTAFTFGIVLKHLIRRIYFQSLSVVLETECLIVFMNRVCVLIYRYNSDYFPRCIIVSFFTPAFPLSFSSWKLQPNACKPKQETQPIDSIENSLLISIFQSRKAFKCNYPRRNEEEMKKETSKQRESV